MDSDRPLALGTLLESAQRRGTRQRLLAPARGLHHLSVAKGIVVIQVFISQRQGMHALTHHCYHLATRLRALVPVAEATRIAGGQCETAVHLRSKSEPPLEENDPPEKSTRTRQRWQLDNDIALWFNLAVIRLLIGSRATN